MSKSEFINQGTSLDFNMNHGESSHQANFARRALFALQSKQLNLIKEASDKFDHNKSYMVHHTFAIPFNELKKVESLLLKQRQEIVEFMNRYHSRDCDQVVQVSSCFVPLTEPL